MRLLYNHLRNKKKRNKLKAEGRNKHLEGFLIEKLSRFLVSTMVDILVTPK